MGIIKVSPNQLEAYSKGVYVDSPVYFRGNRVVRYINWKKLDILQALKFPHKGHCILDFGCGNGVLLPTLSKDFDEVYAMDLHISAASRLVKDYGLNNVNVVRGDGYHIPFADNSFCAIVASSCLEHFTHIRRAIEEIARVLIPSGAFLFLSPTENFFYRFGRWILGYTKPPDHYHSAKEIEWDLSGWFDINKKRNFMGAYSIGLYTAR